MKNAGRKTGLAAIVCAGMALGAPVTLGLEGMKLKPYYDSVDVKTWCGGETDPKYYKPEFTKEECADLFNVRYGFYSLATSKMYGPKAQAVLTPEIHAAMTDMSYNVGIPTVEKSGMMRVLNEGRAADACDRILQYDRASTSVKLIDQLDGKADGKMTCSLTKGFAGGCFGIYERRVKINKLCRDGLK